MPDLKVWNREFRETVGELYAIQGVEAVLEGELVEVDGQLVLRDGKNQSTVRLQPLGQKVQLDPETGKSQLASAAEKDAYERLRARWAKHRGTALRLRITGPLAESAQGEVPLLAVRDFIWPEK